MRVRCSPTTWGTGHAPSWTLSSWSLRDGVLVDATTDHHPRTRGHRPGTACRDRRDRPHTTAPRRLRLRRHALADRRGPDKAAPLPERSPPPRARDRCRRPPRRWSPDARCATSRRSSRLPAEVHLVGSPTAPSSTSASSSALSGVQRALLRARVRRGLPRHRRRPSRAYCWRRKPASVAVHTRRATRRQRPRCRGGLNGPAILAGRHGHPGQGGHRALGRRTDKGTAIDCSAPAGGQAAVFVGDDVTDENAFANLSGPDVGIKIGAGDDRAATGCGPDEAAGCSACSPETRRRWLSGARADPIEGTDARRRLYHGAAHPRGQRHWLCHPNPVRPRCSPTWSAAARPATSRCAP